MSQRYFAQVCPGFEEPLAQELKALGARRRLISRGGVSFEGTKKHLYRALQWSRLASRVWLTLTEGSAPNPDALFQKVRRAPWARYLGGAEQRLAIKVVVHSSPLAGAGQVDSVLWSALRASLSVEGGAAPHPSAWGDPLTTQRALIYIEGERFQLRLDGSGELLHRRGWRVHDGPAPLRPTLAWGCLMALGWRPGQPLIDLMCGAGTFTIEALSSTFNQPPRARTRYACMSWPSFDALAWEEQAQAAQVSAAPPLTYHWLSDVSEESLALARRHLARLEGRAHEGLNLITQRADATTLSWGRLSALWSKLGLPPSPGLIIANPPYGLRVEDHKVDGLSVAQRLSRALPQLMSTEAQGWRAGVLLPSSATLTPPAGWSQSAALEFSHGGLPVTLWRLEPSL